MTDNEIEESLQQLRNCRENERSYRAIAARIEERLEKAGVTFKMNEAGASWKRASGQEEV